MSKQRFLINGLVIFSLLLGFLTNQPLTLFTPVRVVEAASVTTPMVAILASEYTQALDDADNWYSSWHYFVMHNSLEEALRSDGTPFVVLSDANIEAGGLLTGGEPKYPILISLASEAVSDTEVDALRAYVAAGGFLFSGSSSFTRTALGVARGDFALATEMGMHIAGAPTWYDNSTFSKQIDHRLVNGIPFGSLVWYMTPNSWASYTSSFPVLEVSIPAENGAELIGNTASGPLLATKKYGLGQFIYHGSFQPLIGIGGYSSDTYSYLIYRNAIEWAFEEFNLPLIKVSPWPYEYDAALTIRKDYENTPYRIAAIEASEQLNHSVGAKGDYYVCTGTLRADSEDTQWTEVQKIDMRAMLRRAVSLGATIGSHNGGLPNPVGGDPNSYNYWHWGPDDALGYGEIGGYPSGYEYGKASIRLSFEDIRSWLAGLDNGRSGCGIANNCPSIWASPNFVSSREPSRQMMDELNTETTGAVHIVTMGEQNIGPFPHWSLSYDVAGKLFHTVTLPTSEWYIGNGVAQSLEYSVTINHTIPTLRAAVDYYYNQGFLVNIYGHEPTTIGTVHYEYPVYAAAKERIWRTNSVGVYDWWVLRTPVSVVPSFSQMGKMAVAHAAVSGGTDPETAIEMALPNYRVGAINDVNVLINGAPAISSQYRLTSYGVKVKVGAGASTVDVRYTPQLTWEQTDWIGGAGQDNWSDSTRYLSASGVDTSIPGQVHLADVAGVFGPSGTLLSSAFDGGKGAQWLNLGWTATLPASTGFRVRVRSADTLDGLASSTWSAWISSSGTTLTGQTGRWIQYEIELSTSNTAVTPVLSEIHIAYIPGPGVNLTQLSPSSANSEATVTLSAFLLDDEDQPLPGQSVSFTVDGLSPVTATTDGNGLASHLLTLNLAPGTYTLTASFAGTVDYTPITTSQDLVVTASWPTWTQDTQTEFGDNTIPSCLDLTSVPGSVRLTGTTVGDAEEPGTYSIGVGEENESFTLGSQSFTYRNRFTIINPNTTPLPAGYTTTMTLDTAALVNALKLRPDGNDLRIARDTGSSILELDRLLENPNNSSTQITFKLQAGITAGGDDNSYYIYYGNSDPGTPPTNPANVYFLWDDFDGTTINATRWTKTGTGTVTVSNGTALLGTDSDLLSTASATYGLLEARIRTGNLSNVVFWGWEDGPISANHFIVYQRAPNIDGYLFSTPSSTKITLSGDPVVGANWHDYAIRWSPGQAEWFVDGVSRATYSGTTPSVPSTPMNANFYGYEDTVELDWVRVRLYAANPPVISLQTSTTFQYRRGVVVNNVSTTATLPAGYEVKLLIDTAGLTSAGKLLANGNDLRVIWMNGTTPVELDRIAENDFNTSSTAIWFKTQTAIPANSADSNYYIYYGSPSAGIPPTNSAAVFAFWDGFDGTALSTSTWNPSGTIAVSGGQAHLAASSHIFSANSLTYGNLEMRIRAAGENAVMFWGWEETPADANNVLVFQEQASPNPFDVIFGTALGSWSIIAIDDPPGGFTPWHIYGINWQPNNAQWKIDGTQVLGTDTKVPSTSMHININAYSSIPLDVDWVRVRQQFSPEPVVALATTHIEYASGLCEMLSMAHDTGQTSFWKYVLWEGSIPTDTLLTLEIRTADSQAGLVSADWIPYPRGTSVITNPSGRWIQYRVVLNRTSNPLVTPEFQKVTIYFSDHPTGVELNYFRAARAPDGVQLSWETVNEATLAGFNLYRRELDGKFEKLNASLITPEKGGEPIGFAYIYLDDTAALDTRYEYRLEVIETNLEPSASMLAPYWPYSLMLPVVRH